MKIAIINHSMMDIHSLTYSLQRLPQYQIIWTATTASEAIDAYQHECPTLVLLDLFLPDMDCVDIVRYLIAYRPSTILLTSKLIEQHTAKIFAAMSAGATDSIALPSNIEANVDLFHNKLFTIEKLIARHNNTALAAPEPISHKLPSNKQNTLIAIGASTGGPNAVAQVLTDIKDCHAAIVVIQHVGSEFAVGLAEWLQKHSSLPIHLAKNGDSLQPGEVLLGAGHLHLILTKGLTLRYTEDPKSQIYRPSVDVFFNSIAQYWQGKIIGVLLTGIGKDGAAGLQTLRQHGHQTIAQDKQSSVVYGMPKAASQLGAAQHILPLNKIGQELMNLLGKNHV